MKRRLAFLGVVLISILVSFYFYTYYNDVYLKEDEYGLSVTYVANITKIDYAEIELNFVDEYMEFKSKFYADDSIINLNLHPKGFNKNNRCNDNLLLILKDDSQISRTWTNNKPFYLYKHVDVESLDFIELTKTCKFDEEKLPNGRFSFHLFSQNQTQAPLIDKISFKTTFDDKKFGCRGSCVLNDVLSHEEIVPKKDERTILLVGEEFDSRHLKFDLTTYDKESELYSNTAYAFFIGLIMAAIGIGYDLIKGRK